MRGRLLFLCCTVLASGCAGGSLTGADVTRGSQAYAALTPAGSEPATGRDYRIGPNDALTVSVFQEPELSTSTSKAAPNR